MFLEVGCEVVVCTLGVRVVFTPYFYGLVVIGIPADAFVFPSLVNQVVFLAFTQCVEVIAGIRVVYAVNRSIGFLRAIQPTPSLFQPTFAR